MSYDIFHGYGLDKIHDSRDDDQDYKDNDKEQWDLVNSKTVLDSDGFSTEYTWYTNGDKHIFMFGDSDIYEPDEDYADWVTESEQEATSWFNSYRGFDDDTEESDESEDVIDENYTGNADFMNEGFLNIYSDGLQLED